MARRCRLTPVIHKALVKAIRNGVHKDTAARLVGIGVSTFYAWIQAGDNGADADKKEFAENIKKAEAQWEQEQVQGIMDSAEGGQVLSRTTTTKKNGDVVVTETLSRPEWTARAWLLERKVHERWAKRERHELTGDERKPLVIKYVTGESEG